MVPNSNKKLKTARFIESRLSGRGIFLTTQRRLIADILFSRDQHVTAEQLYSQIQSAGHKVSKATVYNTLALFSNHGLLRQINVDGSATFYDSNITHHHHFFNIDSGELLDLEENLLPEYLKDKLPLGTSLDTADLVIRIRNSHS
jgi:Fur family transcriptional regulator, iron response regulator